MKSREVNKEQKEVAIASGDYWFKIVEFLQQNWALIDTTECGVVVWFLNDTSEVFDEMRFPSQLVAKDALRRNGFGRFLDDSEAQKAIAAPAPPFRRGPHPGGPIYSSGKFWI